jgi:hypothetical protein
MDCEINDHEFAEACVHALLENIQRGLGSMTAEK